jgi:hypothetical protein
MNIKRELSRAEFRKNVQDRFKRAISIIRRFLCQHKDCASEIISVSLGNSNESILAELFGEDEAKKMHNLKLRRVYCLNCQRELYREVVSIEELPEENSNVPQD